MVIYWLLFAITAWRGLAKASHKWGFITACSICTVLVIIIGLRHEVGGDWFGYMKYIERLKESGEISLAREPLFEILNWMSLNLKMGVYGVNFVCAAIFSSGLVWFCKSTARPWLAMTMAIPYLVIVVGMGYTRQATAIGLLMFGYSALVNNKVIWFLGWTCLAAAFQQTSLIVLPLAFPYLTSGKLENKILKAILLGIAGYGMARIFLLSRVSTFVSVYIEEGMQSDGALVRVALNVIPSILFLIYSDRLVLAKSEKILWKWMSFYSLACVLGLIFLSSSTVIDRLALYAIPIQLLVASRFPDFKLFKARPKVLNALVIIFAFTVQFVWLNFATHSVMWIPYDNLLWT